MCASHNYILSLLRWNFIRILKYQLLYLNQLCLLQELEEDRVENTRTESLIKRSRLKLNDQYNNYMIRKIQVALSEKQVTVQKFSLSIGSHYVFFLTVSYRCWRAMCFPTLSYSAVTLLSFPCGLASMAEELWLFTYHFYIMTICLAAFVPEPLSTSGAHPSLPLLPFTSTMPFKVQSHSSGVSSKMWVSQALWSPRSLLVFPGLPC